MQALFKEGFEGYFDQHKQREKISTTPFARAPQLNNQEYAELITKVNQIPQYHQIQTEIIESYRPFFLQYATELEQGFNILFYGAGSKTELISTFLQYWDPETTIIGINGYNPATSIKEVINTCVQTLVSPEIFSMWPKLPTERLPVFLDHLETTNTFFSIFINSIDGIALRNLKTQSMLARLAQSPNICLIASCDHINAPVQWSDDLTSRFNFVWHFTPTFKPYTTETSYSDVFSLGQSRASVGAHAVKTVLESLTSNAQNMYKLLISVQYDNMVGLGIKDPNTMGHIAHGLQVPEFYKLCVSKFVVSSEINFKVMFSEFKEHKMLEIAKDKAGLELVYVPYSFEELEQIISDL